MQTKGSQRLEWLSGGGEMADLIRSLDWSKTPLGPIETWPQSLRTTVSLCLSSNFPINIIWGPEATQIYNAGYQGVCGKAHPRATGEPYNVTWASAWPVVGEPFERARRGETSYLENQRMFLERNGYLEETFFTFSLSPIRDESGGVAGLFHPVTETTSTLLSERRTRALRDISNKASSAPTMLEASQLIVKTLSEYSRDLPFVVLSLFDSHHNQARLLSKTGLPENSLLRFETIELADTNWPFKQVLQTAQSQIVTNFEEHFGAISCGEYPEPIQRACVLPLKVAGQGRPLGFIIVGLSTRLPLDEAYQSFLEVLGSSVSSAITNAKAYEEEKKRAEELAAIDRAKTAFFSNVSHEFRTPLTLMLGPLEDSLRDSNIQQNPETKDRQELVYRNAKRLLKLVNTLLEFSRIEANRVQAYYRPTDLAELTRQLAGMFQSTIERAGLKFTTDISTLGRPVYVDRQMWEKIVLNLLSNAFKFTHEGEIRVSLRATSTKAVLEVSDTGIGIPETELSRVFERFHRIEGSRGRSYEGTGIGLALIQELAKLHGGTTNLKSTVGKGSTFSVEIPLGVSHLKPSQIIDDASEASPDVSNNSFVIEASSWLGTDLSPLNNLQPEKRLTNKLTQSGTRPKILVADDNADMRSFIRSVLEDSFDIYMVADGEAALLAALSNPPDVILSDVMMPRLDGFGLVRSIRNNPHISAIPIILLSARAGEESRIEGLEAGADDYLVKPFSTQELSAKIRGLLELGKLRMKYQEDRMYSVFMQTSVGICVQDGPEHIYRLANPTYVSTLFGNRALVGKSIRDALPELEGQGYFEILDEVYKTGKPFFGNELPVSLKQADGSIKEFFLDFVYEPKRSLHGEIDGILTVVSDVTERVLAKKRAEKLTEDLRQALIVRDEFLSVASHELKTPVTSLKLQIQLAKRRIDLEKNIAPTPEKLFDIFDISSKQVNRLSYLIEDLLDVSRIQAGRLEFNFEETSLKKVVSNVLERLSDDLAQAKIVMNVNIGEEILGRWDASRIEQVLANLIGNAIKYAPGKPLAIRAHKNSDHVEIAVQDHGPGIPFGKHSLIFERFERAVTSRNISGLGLGLFIVRKIISAHGGTVEVDSEEGHGATFMIQLPVNPALTIGTC